MPEIIERASVAELPRRPQVSWGAILGGFFFVLAMGWLLFLLGSALGASVLDVTDGSAAGSGLGTGAVLWMILSALIAYFLGSLLAARLAGQPDKTTGMLHGVTLWSLSSAAMLILGYWGVTGALETGQTVLRSAASASATLADRAVEGVIGVGRVASSAAETELANEIQARLSRRASEMVAASSGMGGPDVSPDEVRRAARELDTQTLSAAAIELARGDRNEAIRVIAAGTNLSRAEIASLVDGISARIETQAEELREESQLVRAAEEQLAHQLDALYASASRAAGPSLTTRELKTAASELDRETLREAAGELLAGRTESAQHVIAANTSLSEQEIAALVGGVANEANDRIVELRQQADRAIEASSDYVQGVLWAAFTAGALGLCACIFGGMLGAGTVERLYFLNVSREIQ